MDNPRNDEFLLNEYTDISNNLRHLNDVRSKTMQFTITLYGLLLLTLTAIFKIPILTNIDYSSFAIIIEPSD